MLFLRCRTFVALSCSLFLAGESLGQTAPLTLGGIARSDDTSARTRLSALDRQIAAAPSNARLLLERAALHLQNGDHDRMRADVEKAVSVDSGSADTWRSAGQIISESDPSAAIPYYDTSLKLSPRSPGTLGLRAIAYATLNRFEPAIADIDAALGMSPKDPHLLGLKGNIVMHMGKFNDAVDLFTRSLSIEPLAQVHVDRAFCYLHLDALSQAIEDYTAALQLDGSMLGARLERGLAFQKSGDFRHAVDDLERVRKAKPEDPQVPLLLSWIYATAPSDEIRDGRKALMLAGELCDPVTCQTTEPLNALAAAYAELGDFDKATKLQERAVALSHFAPDFHDASVRRLDTLRKRQPLREATTPLLVLPRDPNQLPRPIPLEEALAAPPDILGTAYLQVQTLLQGCTLARAGATFNADLDGLPVSLTADNAEQMEKRLEDRKRVYREAIRKRGFVQLASGYRAKAAGGCDEWGLGDAPLLAEQDGCDVHLTQGDVRHTGVVVESAVVFRHDMNTGIIITGDVKDGAIVFVTPQRYGITGTAHDRCTLTLSPARVAGEEWANAFVGRAVALRSYEEYAKALADLDRAVELSPTAPMFSIQAYALATWPDKKLRDGKRAVASATRAIELSRGKPDVNVLTAAAVAAAEAGDFANAISYQKRVIGLASDESRPAFEARLRLFESHRPYHEEPAFQNP